MTFDTLGDLNWLAVIVATIAFFALGALWYAPPVLGRAWQRASGAESPEGQRPGIAYYIGPLFTCFLSTVATAMFAMATATDRSARRSYLDWSPGLATRPPSRSSVASSTHTSRNRRSGL
jgi:hypothetical protein